MTRRLVLTRASQIRMRPTHWLWESRLPIGSMCLSAGRAGVAKSQHAAWLTAQITRGQLSGIHYGTPHNVIYAATEDSWEMTLAPRLYAAGADMNRVFRIDARIDDDRDAPLTLPSDTDLLGPVIRNHDVALFVLDPLLSVLDAGVNDYRAREVRAALEPLVTVADTTRCTMLGIAHFTKATGIDPLLLVSGSAGFGQVIRAALGFARDEDTADYVLSQIKNNLGREDLPSLHYSIEPVTVQTDEGPSEVSRFVLGDESERHVRDLLREQGGNGSGEDDADELVEMLRVILDDAHGEIPAADAMKRLRGFGAAPGKTALFRARKRAGIESQKSTYGGGWVWRYTAQGSTKVPKVPTSAHVEPSEPSAESSPQSGGRVIPLTSAKRSLGGCEKHPGTPVTTDGKCPLCILAGIAASKAPTCAVCGDPLDDLAVRHGWPTHTDCEAS